MTRSELYKLYPAIKNIKDEFLLHNYTGKLDHYNLPVYFNTREIPYDISDGGFGETVQINSDTRKWYINISDNLYTNLADDFERINELDQVTDRVELVNIISAELDMISTEYDNGIRIYLDKSNLHMDYEYEKLEVFNKLTHLIHITQYDYLLKFKELTASNRNLYEMLSEEYVLKRKSKILFNLTADEIATLYTFLLELDIIDKSTEKKRLVSLIANTLLDKSKKGEMSVTTLTNKMNKDVDDFASLLESLDRKFKDYKKNMPPKII